MGLGRFVRRYWPGRYGREYYECRQCGTSLEPEVEECPVCGEESVAEYELR